MRLTRQFYGKNVLKYCFGRNGYSSHSTDKPVSGLNVTIKDEDVGTFSCQWKLGRLTDRPADRLLEQLPVTSYMALNNSSHTGNVNGSSYLNEKCQLIKIPSDFPILDHFVGRARKPAIWW